ncbi:MAG: hypothetical protein WC884_01180 [Candidatus Paceibacterota bacterium]
METFKKGEYKYGTEHFRSFAEIHEMAEKLGWIGKTISFEKMTKEKWEEVKAGIIKSTQLIDKYLGSYIPNYYFTFEENEESRSVVYFMEEVKEDRHLPPAGEVDNFLVVFCQMFSDTTRQGESFLVDLHKIENFIYGHTADKPQPQLYFIDFFPFYFGNPLIKKEKILFFLSEFAKIYGKSSFPKTNEAILKLNQLEA